MPAERDARPPDHLYGLAREDFIPARDALVKELRAAGDRDGAAEVKRLRKPSLAAWALNVTARGRPEDVAGLLEAGDALREAQDAALAGNAGGIRPAGRNLAEEVQRLADIAAGALPGDGGSQRDRIVATLRAAATDATGADLLRRGVLVEDLEPAGFGLGDGASPGDTPREAEATSAAARSSPAEAARASPQALTAARADLHRAESEAESAGRRLERATDRSQRAEQRLADARREADDARSDAAAARDEADAARDRLAGATEHLAELEAGTEP